MINLEDIITASSIIWIKKNYWDNTERQLKHTLERLSKQKKKLKSFLIE